MTSIVRSFSTHPGLKPTKTGLEPGQIAVNLQDRLMFVGDGSDVFTQADGTTRPGPPAGKGFIELELEPEPQEDKGEANG